MAAEEARADHQRVGIRVSQSLHPAARCIVPSAANLLVVLGEAATNQRHVEREGLPGLGDRAVVAVYAQFVVVVWRVRRDRYNLHEAKRGRGQHGFERGYCLDIGPEAALEYHVADAETLKVAFDIGTGDGKRMRVGGTALPVVHQKLLRAQNVQVRPWAVGSKVENKRSGTLTVEHDRGPLRRQSRNQLRRRLVTIDARNRDGGGPIGEHTQPENKAGRAS